MSTTVEINPEITQLLQRTCSRTHIPFEQQLVRSAAEEAVMACPPELELLLESDATLSELTPLARSLGVNDIVVNGKHIHVSALAKDQTVRINRALTDTRYLENGSLVVRLSGSTRAEVIGHISAETWSKASAKTNTNSDDVKVQFEPSDSFDLPSFLSSLSARELVIPTADLEVKAADYIAFLKDPFGFSLETQRRIISSLLVPKVRDNLTLVASAHEDSLAPLLKDAAIWDARVERLCTKLSEKFISLNRERVKKVVLHLAEKMGGQVDLPEFQKALLGELTVQIVSSKLSAQAHQQIKGMIDRIYAGSSAISAVKHYVKNQLTVDLAQAIDQQRTGIIDFALASSEEFSIAFRALALQPAYATHSQQESIDLETVNEALILLETAKLAEELKNLEL
jgi:hypothetical protein